MYKNILVPVDGSEASTLGMSEAIEVAKNQGARIRLVHVLNDLMMFSSDPSIMHMASFLQTVRADAESLLARSQTAVREAGIDVDCALLEAMGGQAGTHIVKQAAEWPADLIVCGTHGRRGVRRIVLGSDAEYIVRYTPVPVLLVRAQREVN